MHEGSHEVYLNISIDDSDEGKGSKDRIVGEGMVVVSPFMNIFSTKEKKNVTKTALHHPDNNTVSREQELTTRGMVTSTN